LVQIKKKSAQEDRRDFSPMKNKSSYKPLSDFGSGKKKSAQEDRRDFPLMKNMSSYRSLFKFGSNLNLFFE